MSEPIKDHLTGGDVFSDPRFPLTILRRDPQIPFPKHTHDFSELVIVYSGQGIHFTDDEEYSISAGDVFVVTGDRSHGYRRPEQLQLLNIVFDQSLLSVSPVFESELNEINGYHALFTWEPRLRSEHRFESRLRLGRSELAETLLKAGALESELSAKGAGYRAMALSIFIQLCGFLSRQYDSSSSPEMKELSRLSGVLSYLEQNTSRCITTGELTSFAGMSESTLLRLFHKTTGTSPVEYHNRLRIKKVCGLLKSTGKTVTEIAFETGFGDSNYLSRLFKKVMGVPPGAWRKGG